MNKSHKKKLKSSERWEYNFELKKLFFKKRKHHRI